MAIDLYTVTTPTLGTVLRAARERRDLSVRQLAAQAGLSPGFLTRVEHDRANPTWRTIEQLAAALQAEPTLRLVADEGTVAGTARLVAHETPLGRLLRQRVDVLFPLSLFVRSRIAFVATGSVAALLQGFPTPVTELHVIVEDSNETLLALQQLLLDQVLLFNELEPDELREVVQRSWAIGDCAVNIRLASELPASQPIALDGMSVPVVLPQTLLNHPEVAATLRISPVQSSDL